MPVVVTDSPATRAVDGLGVLTAGTVRLTGGGTGCASTCTSRPGTDIIAGVAERFIGLPGPDAGSDLAGGAGVGLPTLRAVVVAVVLVLLGASGCATPSGPTAVRFVRLISRAARRRRCWPRQARTCWSGSASTTASLACSG